MNEQERQHIVNIIKNYELTFYAELRSQIDKHKQIVHVIPDFLKGFRDIDIIFANDGVLIFHFDSKIDEFHVHSYDKSMFDIIFMFSYIPSLNAGFVIEADHKDEIGGRISVARPEWKDKEGNLVDAIPWMLLDVINGFSYFSNIAWSKDIARLTAIEDIQTFIISNLLKLEETPQHIYSDNRIVFNKLESLVNEFNSLLDSAQKEEELQQFLNNNPILIAPNAVTIDPKVRLGSEHVTDFVITTHDDNYVLIEIEKSTKKLYNKNGDPSADLTHAIKQAEDWRRWIHENISYARQTLPNITDPNCWVILGRRKDLTYQDTGALKRMNLDNQHITIFTYDDLINNLKIILKNLRVCSAQDIRSVNPQAKPQSGASSKELS
jgi:hypothetical protein